MSRMIKPVQRFNRKTRGEPIIYSLGKNKFFPEQDVYFTERMAFGVHIVGANTRYGKAGIVSIIATKSGQYRPVIFIDYAGEHKDRKYPNFLSESNNTMCLPDLVEYQNFKFKISQFSSSSDWLALSYPPRASQLMSDLSKQFNSHHDNPKMFLEMMEDLPITGQWGKTETFRTKWGFDLPAQNGSVVQSAKTITTWLIRSEFFAEQDDPLYDFGKIALRNGYLDINFNLHQTDVAKARAMAGIVLRQIKKVIPLFAIPPLLVIEEADVLAPAYSEDVQTITSLAILVEMVLKLQKFGIELLFVVQDLRQLNASLWGNYHTLILGQMPLGNPYSEQTSKLSWNIDLNYREFVMITKGSSKYDVFIPEDMPTLY